MSTDVWLSTPVVKISRPLAGIVALQLWSFASAVSVLIGVAISAQLEAVRAGLRQPAEADPEEQPAQLPASPRLADAQPS